MFPTQDRVLDVNFTGSGCGSRCCRPLRPGRVPNERAAGHPHGAGVVVDAAATVEIRRVADDKGVCEVQLAGAVSNATAADIGVVSAEGAICLRATCHFHAKCRRRS